MYNAFGSLQGNNSRGSTRLHMDVTDAANILHWAPSSSNDPGCAVWHLFPADSTPLLRKFLVQVAGFNGPGDPIHSQQFYLTPGLLDRLWVDFGVKPYVIRQYVGQTVFIPAGCPHQVSFMSMPFIGLIQLTRKLGFQRVRCN